MQMLEDESLELSIVMPCLNEETSVAFCVEEALEFIRRAGISGEVLVADNGSEDQSASIAKKHGARVVQEKRRGYGNAVRAGIANSRGRIILIGDCDTTYDFLHLEEMYELLKNCSCDMVIGDRYAGGLSRGSMKLSHRIGVRFLSFCGRLRFNTEVYDFHCGLRGLSRKSARQLEFRTEGMEFATEMIAAAAQSDLRICQVPVVLRKAVSARKSKLRTIRDGWRHLKYIIHY